jgi:hypothetical protein
MAGNKGSGTRKKGQKGCKALTADVAHWMLPDTISIRDGGSCNVVIVVPYGYPTEDDNAEILGALLADALDGYAVINNRLYFREGRSRPKKKKADLGSLTDAKVIDDYWIPLQVLLEGIPTEYQSKVVVIFIHGMEDAAADKFQEDLMFAIGAGFIGEYDASASAASKEFLKDLMTTLKAYIVSDKFEEYAQPCSLPAELRKEFGQDVEAVTIAVRCEGHRDAITRIQTTAGSLAHSIKQLNFFKTSTNQEPIYFGDDSDDDNTEARVIETPDGRKFTVVSEGTGGNRESGKKERAMDTAEAKKDSKNEGSNSGSEAVIGKDALAAIIARLKSQDHIDNDKGELIKFSGEVRDTFVADVKKSYPVVKAMVSNIFDTGKFFHEAKERQKKNGLWIAFTDTIGLSRRTAHNYIQAYERLGTSMSDYSYLGVTKLLTVTRVKKPVEYLKEHADEIAQESTVQVRQRVAQETKRNTSGQKRRKPTEKVEEMGYQNVKAALAPNGRVLKLMGLNKELQEEILKLVKSHFSKKK